MPYRLKAAVCLSNITENAEKVENSAQGGREEGEGLLNRGIEYAALSI